MSKDEVADAPVTHGTPLRRGVRRRYHRLCCEEAVHRRERGGGGALSFSFHASTVRPLTVYPEYIRVYVFIYTNI